MKNGIYSIVALLESDNINFTILKLKNVKDDTTDANHDFQHVDNTAIQKFNVKEGDFYIHIVSDKDGIGMRGVRNTLEEAKDIFDKLNRVMNPHQYQYIGE